MVQLVASIIVPLSKRRRKWVQHSIDIQGGAARVQELRDALADKGCSTAGCGIRGPCYQALPTEGTVMFWVGSLASGGLAGKDALPTVEYNVATGEMVTIGPVRYLKASDTLVPEGAYEIFLHKPPPPPIHRLKKTVPSTSQVSASLCLRGVSAKDGVQVFVRGLTGKNYTFEYLPSFSKVYDLKLAIQEKEGILIDDMRLIFAGRQLEDEVPLSDYGIGREATIDLVLRLRGGMFHLTSGYCGFQKVGEGEVHECKMPSECGSLKTTVMVKVNGSGEEGSPPREVAVEAFGCDRMEDLLKRIREGAEGRERETGEKKKRLAPESESGIGAEIAMLAGEMEDGGQAVLDELRRSVAKKRGRK